MKLLVNLLCCFVPLKSWRKEIKRKLIGTRSRFNRLLAFGCKIDNHILITPRGVRIDISNVPHEVAGIVKEVFLKEVYAVHFIDDAVLIDIGLNRGIASLFFATYPNIKRIYAFEPFKPTFRLAKRNLELNPQLSQKIHAFNVGLGRAEVTLELPYMASATGGMSTTLDVCTGEKNTTNETVAVKDAAKEIAQILEKNKTEHIIVKCDCEGAEYEIFERLNEEKLIGEIDVILMEYHRNGPDELLDMITKNGFVVRTKVLSQKMGTGYVYAVRMVKK